MLIGSLQQLTRMFCGTISGITLSFCCATTVDRRTPLAEYLIAKCYPTQFKTNRAHNNPRLSSPLHGDSPGICKNAIWSWITRRRVCSVAAGHRALSWILFPLERASELCDLDSSLELACCLYASQTPRRDLPTAHERFKFKKATYTTTLVSLGSRRECVLAL